MMAGCWEYRDVFLPVRTLPGAGDVLTPSGEARVAALAGAGWQRVFAQRHVGGRGMALRYRRQRGPGSHGR